MSHEEHAVMAALFVRRFGSSAESAWQRAFQQIGEWDPGTRREFDKMVEQGEWFLKAAGMRKEG